MPKVTTSNASTKKHSSHTNKKPVKNLHGTNENKLSNKETKSAPSNQSCTNLHFASWRGMFILRHCSISRFSNFDRRGVFCNKIQDLIIKKRHFEQMIFQPTFSGIILTTIRQQSQIISVRQTRCMPLGPQSDKRQ